MEQSTEQPTFRFSLPDGDDREVKTRFISQAADGAWDVAISVTPGTVVTELAAELVAVYSIFQETMDKVERVADRRKKMHG